MSRFGKNTLKYSIANSLLMSLALMAAPQQAHALPQNGIVAGGSASIETGAKSVDVAQSTDRAIINWGSFDIAANEAVRFAQPSSSSVTLNRVTGGGNASQIYGVLSANGNIVLVNPQGVFIGAGAQVNVGGLIATTSNVSDDNFMNGKLIFEATGNPNASVINKGNIAIADGGLVALVGPNVTNDGLIQAKLGRVHLASGDVFTIDLYGDGLIKIQASDALTKQILANGGKIEADGGEILMTAAAAQTTVDSLINMSGVLQANSVGEKKGRIILTADKGTTKVTGTISAKGAKSGEKGGTVKVLGDNVNVAEGALIDASGVSDGGFVETSGNSLDVAGTVNASSLEGAAGLWLLDPQNIRIMSAACPWYGCIGYSRVSTSSIQGTLNTGGNVTITTNGGLAYFLQAGNITIEDSITKSGGGDATLTLNAINDIVLNDGVVISSTHNKLNVVLNADTDHSGAGDIFLGDNAGLRSNRGFVTFNGRNITMAEDSFIRTSGGNATLNGTGAIEMDEDSSIKTSGGDITLTGFGTGPSKGGVTLIDATLDASDFHGGGDIAISGSGYYSTLLGASYGVVAQDSTIKTSGHGDISIGGYGGDSGFSLAGLDNFGAYLLRSAISTTGNGDIHILGVGGDSANIIDVNNYGLRLKDTTVSSSGGSDITMTGIGGADHSLYGVDNHGLILEDHSAVKTTYGDILMTGIAGTNASLLGGETYGIYIKDANNVGDHHDRGEITFVADTIKVDDCGPCGAGHLFVQTSDNVTFRTYSAPTTIGVAGATGTLQITSHILDDVKAKSITIGSLTNGDGKLTANSYDWDPDAIFLTNTGDIILAGKQEMGSHTFLADTAAGDIWIGPFGGVKSYAHGTAITLAASYGNFYNFGGPHALETSWKGRWLIYSTSPFTDIQGGLVSDFHRYSCTYGGACPDFHTEKGDGNLYRFTPYLAVLADSTTVVYGDPATYSYSLFGYLPGDRWDDHVTGGVNYSTPYVIGSDVGHYPLTVTSGTLASALGYGFIYGIPNCRGVTVTPAPLTVIANSYNLAFGQPFPVWGYAATGFKAGDDYSIFTGGLTTTASVGSGFGSYPITQGSLSAGGNYTIAFVDGVLTITIPGGDISTADQQSKYEPPVIPGLGYRGVLLAMSNAPSGLGNLAPAAGGYRPMTPEELSGLAPAAGGAPGTMGSVMALIECNDDAPCQINE